MSQAAIEPPATVGPQPAVSPLSSEAGNLRGILAMLASLAAFVANDTCVKLASSTVPIGEIIALRNGAATLYLAIAAAIFGGMRLPPHPPVRLLTLRMIGEVVSTLLFLSALVYLPLGDVTAVAQFTPLAMTAAAAVFLGEPVGWRRWAATVAGLAGVAFIVRPGSAAFSPAGAMVVASIAFVVLRDLTTRLISPAVPTLLLTATSAASGIIAGLVLWPFETWRMPAAYEAFVIALAGLFLTFGYGFIIVALRTGDVGIVSPFRYAIILFALASGYLVWGEVPDGWAAIGIVIICAAGLYTVQRERVRQRETANGSEGA